MRGTRGGSGGIASLVLCVVLALGVTGSDAVAGAGGPERSVFLSAALGVHGFTGDRMQDGYGQLFGGSFQVSPRSARRVEWRLETGLWIAVGDPAIPDTTWTVESSEMQTAVAPLGATALYRLTDRGDGSGFVPYVGLGLEGYFGFERTSITMSREVEGNFEWNDTKFRKTFGGHAILGASFGLTDRARGLVEIRWTQGGDGSVVEQSFSEEEIARGWLEAAEAVRRPDFNFTGWNVSLGVRW